MKRLISAILASLMLLGTAPAAFAAEGEPPLSLTADSHLFLDTEKGYVDMIDGTVTVADLKAEFASAITVKTGDTEKADDKFVATDDVISAGSDSLKALIYGDVDRTGKINLSDVSGTMKYAARWNPDVNADAADVDKSGAVNLQDASKLMKFIAGFEDISLGNVRLVYDNKAETAENEDASLKLSFANNMQKLGANEVTHTGNHAYKIRLAKNEYESCQVYLYSDTDREGLTISITDFVSEYGDATMEAQLHYSKLIDHAIFTFVDPENFTFDKVNATATGDYYPEVVLPLADSFEIKAGTNEQFIITAKSTKDTPAGMYTATLSVRDAEGKEVKRATVYTYVWDFALPDSPYSASLFSVASNDGGNDYRDYYEYMLEMNISGYYLPYHITDPRADDYMNDPRVTAFIIAGGVTGDNGELGTDMYGGGMNCSNEETVANYNKVADNPEWFKKGLFYYFDEPWGKHLDRIGPTFEYVTNLLGTTNIRHITPLAGNDGNGNDTCQKESIDPVSLIEPYINVWCPQSPAFHPWSDGGKWGLRRFVQKYGEFVDRAAKFKEEGDEMWWYVCCSPEPPYANYFTYYQGVIIRDLSWQQFMSDVDGVLYYATGQGWGGITKHKFDIGNGDGTLLFPGEKFGFTGPQASWRLLQIRDGFDDFDMLRIAEELCGREAVMKVVNKVTDGMLRYTEDYSVLYGARDEIAKMILAAQEK